VELCSSDVSDNFNVELNFNVNLNFNVDLIVDLNCDYKLDPYDKPKYVPNFEGNRQFLFASVA